MRDELRREIGAAAAPIPTRGEEVPEPPADLFARVGDEPQPHQERDPYGGRPPFWVTQ